MQKEFTKQYPSNKVNHISKSLKFAGSIKLRDSSQIDLEKVL